MSAGGAVLVDTNVASDLLKARLPSGFAELLIGRELVISFVTIGELTKWLFARDVGQKRRALIGRWIEARSVLLGDVEVAERWGEMDAYALRRGRPRPANDTWIAAVALTHGLPVATLNTRDFEDFVEHEGLELLSA